MSQLTIAPGQAYRLLTNFEVHDEKTGTIRAFALKGTRLKVRRVASEQDRVWVEGYDYPFPLGALEKKVSAIE